jgi:hypothetical protein
MCAGGTRRNQAPRPGGRSAPASPEVPADVQPDQATSKTTTPMSMYEGRIIGIVDRGRATREQLGLMMAGVPQAEALQA